MSIEIKKKITGFEVVKADAEPAPADTACEPPAAEVTSNVVQMHERVERPPELMGATYKLRTPVNEHAMYITINDIVLNEGTPHELRRPFEIFINSKNMEHFQWIVALTRICSAVFRKGGDVTFLVEELKAVFDPQGGYWQPGGRFVPSLVAEIGQVIEKHLINIGMMQQPEMDAERAAFIKKKKEEFELQAPPSSDFPDAARMCEKCNTKALVMMDGCMTCLNCGNSKCG